MTGKEKATAPVSSVGADGKQPLCNKITKSIAIANNNTTLSPFKNIIHIFFMQIQSFYT